MSPLSALGLLLISIFVAWAGGHLFIQGVGVVSRIFRLTGITAGLLIASVSSSSPELFVGVSSALRELPEISLGDVLGSNIANIALVFGIFLILSSSRLSKHDMRTSDVLIACAAPITVLLMSLDGMLSKWDGLLLIFIFALWVRWLVTQKVPASPAEQHPGTLLHFATGLAMLVVAGYTFTESAGALASIFGMNLFLLSSVIVALGTSMPELATTLIALRMKRAELAVGNLLGSNVFNSLGILGLVTLIQPFAISPTVVVLPVAFAVLATSMTLLTRRYSAFPVGIFLVFIYAFYLFASTQI